MTQTRLPRAMIGMAILGVIVFVALNRIIPKFADCGTSIALLTAAALVFNAISCAVAVSLGNKPGKENQQ